ncbi:MAG: hypothetical protein AAGF12_37885, partial [Myxococcota bacterium]
EAGAEARGRRLGGGKTSVRIDRMLADESRRLAAMHRTQVHRDPWPDFASFDASAYSKKLLRTAAVQWAGRARAEHGSVHQFSELTHALSEARAPLQLLGSLGRLITDEVRHAELCSEMALVCGSTLPDEPHTFRWPIPRAPWKPAPHPADGDEEAVHLWAADAVMTACCLGETLSKPMLDGIATVTTDPVAEAVAAQILRDEHLHSAFGWEALEYLLGKLNDESREELQHRLGRRLWGFEKSTCLGIPIEDVAETEIVIAPSAEPNLGTLTDMQYAMMFFHTMEQEILPKFRELGLDADRAWGERLSHRAAAKSS